MLESDDNHLRRCHANSDSLRACITYITFLNIGRDKSLVDDLNMGQGIVSRGACLPCDPLRFSPCPEDLLRQQHLSPHPPHPSPRFAYRLPYVNLLHLFIYCADWTTACASACLGFGWLKDGRRPLTIQATDDDASIYTSYSLASCSSQR